MRGERAGTLPGSHLDPHHHQSHPVLTSHAYNSVDSSRIIIILNTLDSHRQAHSNELRIVKMHLLQNLLQEVKGRAPHLDPHHHQSHPVPTSHANNSADSSRIVLIPSAFDSHRRAHSNGPGIIFIRLQVVLVGYGVSFSRVMV